ncbi:hypothetical protein TNIN_227931 [Trichonephila inaurata madagascariensis]|uniref:Uncharacterized protein n=1 Tax=Trichonephila inaurata madagascariensis TaxID=2747483 RepID=A0A8X7CTD7_9ARAC|nr:hypothetical protein TNIN_227931 [Trichonephila inaurata madagascariensis]
MEHMFYSRASPRDPGGTRETFLFITFENTKTGLVTIILSKSLGAPLRPIDQTRDGRIEFRETIKLVIEKQASFSAIVRRKSFTSEFLQKDRKKPKRRKKNGAKKKYLKSIQEYKIGKEARETKKAAEN